MKHYIETKSTVMMKLNNINFTLTCNKTIILTLECSIITTPKNKATKNHVFIHRGYVPNTSDRECQTTNKKSNTVLLAK